MRLSTCTLALALAIVFVPVHGELAYHQAAFPVPNDIHPKEGSRLEWAWHAPCVDGSRHHCKRPSRDEHRVGPLPWEEGQEPIVESFAGHMPIRSWQEDGLHGETSMFYWFFPALKPKVKDPPMIIWLQGGPGSSSMIGLFFENGPIQVTKNMKLARLPSSWADNYSMLFIDQPVGTGYSYVTRLEDDSEEEVMDPDAIQAIMKKLQAELEQDQQEEQDLFSKHLDKSLAFKSEVSRKHAAQRNSPMYSRGYVKDQRGVVTDLLLFLEQFYTRYPEQRRADLYIAGESYAGKYVPALAYGILEANKKSSEAQKFVIPLKGIGLGNSLTDPITQIQVHADHAFYLGLLTRAQANRMRDLQDKAVQEAQQGRFLASNQYRLAVFDTFKNSTGGLNWYDIRKGSIPNDWSRMEAFMNLAPIKDALNVYAPRKSYLKQQGVSKRELERIEEVRAKTKYFKDPLVIKTMGGDIMKSAAWMVSELLEQGVQVLAYQGIFDYRDAVAGSNAWIDALEWSGQDRFLDAERKLWKVDGHLAGFVTSAQGLTKIAILGAGHLAPMDQGVASLMMIQSLVEGTELQFETTEEGSKESHII